MKISLMVIVLLSSAMSLGAIPQNVQKKADLSVVAEEILSFPEQNRWMLAKQKADELFPVFVELAQNPKKTMHIRWKALTLASRLQPQKVAPVLEQALQSEEWFMRNAALIALHSLDPEKGKAAALRLLKDKALVVRSAAVETLPSLSDAGLRDVMWEEFSAQYNFHQKKSLWIRGQILEKLATAPEKKEMSLWVQSLQGKDVSLYAPSIKALAKLQSIELGKPKDSISKKRDLWLAWIKNNKSAVQ